MNSLVLPPVALGPVTARRSVLNLPRDRRAMSRNFCKPLSTLLKHRHPQLIAPRRLLSSTSSSTFNHRVDKMPAKENAWVGYQGAAGFDLRSKFATILYYLYRKGTLILTIRLRRHPDDANGIYASGHCRLYAHGRCSTGGFDYPGPRSSLRRLDRKRGRSSRPLRYHGESSCTEGTLDPATPWCTVRLSLTHCEV